MHTDTHVLSLLDSQNVNYQITEWDDKQKSSSPQINTSNIIKSIILQDAKGRVQLLIPDNSIVDVGAVDTLLGRHFEATPLSDLFTIMEDQHLVTIPAIPYWQNIPVVVDHRILEQQTLWLEMGDKIRLLELSQDDFLVMIKDAPIGNLTHPAPAPPVTPSNDASQIEKSVKNFTTLRIEQRLEETLDLPPLPQTAQRIIALRANPNADINDLTSIVEVDPSLAAQIVSWAGSPYYSAPGNIKSVHDAIVRVLGFDMVLNLALGLSLGRTLSPSVLSKTQLNEYWQTSIYMAATMEGLVTNIEREHRPSFGMSYLSGLLSNIGYLILADVFPPYAHRISSASHINYHLPASVIEQDVLGITGHQIAAYLLNNWNMPEEVVTAIRHQSRFCLEGNSNQYGNLLYVSRTLLANQGFGRSLGAAIPDSTFEHLHLDRGTAEVTAASILESSENLDEIVSLMQN